MPELINNLIANLTFIFDRLTWLSIIDLALVTLVFFVILLLVRDTQAMVLLRGVLLIFVFVTLLATIEALPAFSTLMSATLPALIVAIPVIFAPEIRPRVGTPRAREHAAPSRKCSDQGSGYDRLGGQRCLALVEPPAWRSDRAPAIGFSGRIPADRGKTGC